MGKAASQRKAKRMKVLSDMAKNSPDVFEKEWNKRVQSWLALIAKQAGALRDEKGSAVEPVFEILDEANETLRFCGEDIFKKYGQHTYEVLSNECCKQLANRIDSRLCLTNNFHRLERTAIYHAR